MRRQFSLTIQPDYFVDPLLEVIDNSGGIVVIKVALYDVPALIGAGFPGKVGILSVTPHVVDV